MVKISLCMITKNEEDCIAESLNSVKDFVDEMIVIDTGNADKTNEIAKQCGAKVYDFKWNNDFSAARNFGLEKAKGDWILILDADEVITQKDHSRIKKLIENKDIDGYIPIIRTYTHERRLNDWYPSDDYAECKNYPGYCIEQPLRLFRNKKEYRFEGRVHESAIPSIERMGGKIGICQVPIHHYGGVRKKSKMTEKQQRYIQLCEKQLLKDPDDVKTRYELSLSLIQQDQYEKAREHLEKIKQKQPNYKNTLLFLAETYTREGKLDEAIKIHHEFIAYQPRNATPWANIGFLYCVQNNLDQARRYLKKALQLNPNNPAVYDQLSEILVIQGETEKARQLLELALKYGRTPSHLNNLACIYRTLGKNEEARKLWNETKEQLEKIPEATLQSDPLLRQTYEKVQKNLANVKS